jgi:Mycothiol maleylpyruvate isomerase N-terminal domain
MTEALPALHASVGRLRRVVGGLQPGQVRQSAYPSEWTIADTRSHLGSGAVILRRRFEDIVGGRQTDDQFSQSVWDEWNAKPPEDQAAEALAADATLLNSLESSTDGQRRDFLFAVGPMQLDFDGFVGLRLSEHVVHTWDVEGWRWTRPWGWPRRLCR